MGAGGAGVRINLSVTRPWHLVVMGVHHRFPSRNARRWTRAVDYGALPIRPRGWAAAARGLGPLLWIAPLAVFTAVLLTYGGREERRVAGGIEPVRIENAPDAETLMRRRWPNTPEELTAAQPDVGGMSAGAAAAGFRGGEGESASFARCSGPVRTTCVVDGDTFWYRGTKFRVADIDAPEVSRPGCAREAALGERATARLTALLNAGPFTLAPAPGSPNTDRYGRTLREVRRGGESLGATLVSEGLAEEWGGPRVAWC